VTPEPQKIVDGSGCVSRGGVDRPRISGVDPSESGRSALVKRSPARDAARFGRLRGNVYAMSSLMNKLTKFAQSPQGKKFTDKAQQFANDPKTKAKVEQAKLKLADMRGGGSTGGTGAAKTDKTPDGPTAA